jgi:nitrogen regulatory protein PII
MEIKGFGRQKGHVEFCRDAEYDTAFIPKIKIEVLVADNLLDKTLVAIIDTAKTGKIGDGKIFVSSLDQVIDIRTGETGDDAI